MRAPPENRNARLAPGVGRELAIESWKLLDSPFPAANQVLITAVPVGMRWRLKALDHVGGVDMLPAVFHNRLEALGAGVLLARQCRGTLLP